MRIADPDPGAIKSLPKELKNISYFLQDFFNLFLRTLAGFNFVSVLWCYQFEEKKKS